MTAGLIELRATGSRRLLPLLLALTAEAEAKAGLVDRAARTIAEGFAALDRTGDIVWRSELHRLNGDLLSAAGERSAAERNYDQALAIARRQRAKLFELRSATSLARLWRGQGKRQEACDLLAPIYNWFTEGFDAPDLIEAKALLDELGC